MPVLLPTPACCHKQLPTSPLPKVCLLHIRFYTQNILNCILGSRIKDMVIITSYENALGKR